MSMISPSIAVEGSYLGFPEFLRPLPPPRFRAPPAPAHGRLPQLAPPAPPPPPVSVSLTSPGVKEDDEFHYRVPPYSYYNPYLYSYFRPAVDLYSPPQSPLRSKVQVPPPPVVSQPPPPPAAPAPPSSITQVSCSGGPQPAHLSSSVTAGSHGPTNLTTSGSGTSGRRLRRTRPVRAAGFVRGSLIRLSSGELRRVEEMRTEDFISSAESCPALRLDPSTVVRIDSTQDSNLAVLTLRYGESRSQVEIESSVDHPYFVYGQGWASCRPEKTMATYGLKCHLLQVGDVCISLTPRPSGSDRKRRWSAPDPTPDDQPADLHKPRTQAPTP